MAGDWIKMRCDLATDPAVVSMALELDMPEDVVVGKLHKVWSWFDQQTENGCAAGVTDAWLDRYVSATGFCNAMKNARWLMVDSNGLRIPKFDRHNGKSGKARALSSKRMQRSRCARTATKAQPDKREDKREEKNTTPPLPPSLDTSRFRDTWTEWEAHRRHKGARLTPESVRRQFKKLEAIGHDRAIAAIEHSIAQGYQGIFEDNGNGSRPGVRPGKVRGTPGKYDAIDAQARRLGSGEQLWGSGQPAPRENLEGG